MIGTINPIISGFAPDPSVTRIDDVFFLVNSTFHLFPGLPIYASRDMKTWTQIGNAINRRSQLSLALSDTKLHRQKNGSTMLATGGLFAPTIRYHQASKTVYVICTNIIHPADGGEDVPQNFIVSTRDIFSNVWSDPVHFNFLGIDPSIFWDDIDNAYVCGSRGPGPMTTISLFEIDLSTGSKLSAEKTIWKGTGGIYPEGPHIYKKDGWYYLLISEGDTWIDHCITVARSKDLWGPYKSYVANPILTARHKLDEYVQATGHCDMFEDLQGNWWGVCLGIRMRGPRCIMGRESFLVNGRWDKGQWPALDTVVLDPAETALTAAGSNDKLSVIKARSGADFVYLRDVKLENHRVEENGVMVLTADVGDISQWRERTTFVGKRQRRLEGLSSVTLELPENCDEMRAGIAVYKDEHRFARIYWCSHTQSFDFEIVNQAKGIQRQAQSDKIHLTVGSRVRLIIEYSEDKMEFSYQPEDTSDSSSSTTALGVIDTAELSGPDFVGPVHGIFAVGKRQANVIFRSFNV